MPFKLNPITGKLDLVNDTSSGGYTDEQAQDAVGGILTDTASVDLVYSDGVPSIEATVIPGGVDHNSLANLTSGDPHTQYIKDPGTVVDKEILIWSGTGGRDLETSSGVAIGASTATQIRPTASNTNFLIDGNGSGRVQFNTGSDSQQFPKTRPALLLDPYLTINQTNGNMSWADMPPTPIVTLDSAYSNGPTITLAGGVGKVEIQDTAAGLAGNLFEVESNAGVTQYFAVSAAGITTSGTVVATGTISASNFSGASSGTNTGDQNIFQTVATTSGTSPVADSTTDTLTLAAGTGMTVTGDSSTDTVTFATTITQYTDEMAQDAAAALIQNGTGISWSYNDGANTLTPTVSLSPFSTSDLAEGSNLYFTDERAQDAVGTILVDSASIDFTYADATPSITAVVIPAGVDHNSLANLTAGDPHTQYILDPGTVTDDAIVTWDGTTGRAVQNSVAILTSAGALSGLTQLDVDNLRLDGNTISSTNASGNINLDSNGGLVFVGNGTTPESFQCLHAGLGDVAPSTSRIININETSSVVTNGIFMTLVHNGSTGAVRAMNFTVTHSGSAGAPTATSSFTAAHTNDSTGTTTILGVSGTATCDAQITQGTKVYNGVRGEIIDNNGTHTGGTVRAAVIQALAPPTFAGAATTHVWAGLFAGDLQVNQNNKLLLDGNNNTKGDTYWTYSSTNTDVEFFLDNTKLLNWDEDVMQFETILGSKAGTSSTYAKIGGTINVNTTAVGNVGAGEDDLMTYTVPANVLAVNGDRLEFRMAGTFAANANNKRVRIKYGATTLLDTTALAFNAAEWAVNGQIIRTGATTQKAICVFSSSSTLLTTTTDYTTPGETLSGTVVLKATGEATSNDDITEEMSTVMWQPVS